MICLLVFTQGLYIFIVKYFVACWSSDVAYVCGDEHQQINPNDSCKEEMQQAECQKSAASSF
jgi:hypothetical protein